MAGKPATFWLYGALAVVAFIVVLKLIPETKGKRLEEIEEYWTNGRRWPKSEASAAAG